MDILDDSKFTATCSLCGKDFPISREKAERIADMEYYPADELVCPECRKHEDEFDFLMS